MKYLQFFQKKKNFFQDATNRVYRVIQCKEKEVTQLMSSLTDGWKFEQVYKKKLFFLNIIFRKNFEFADFTFLELFFYRCKAYKMLCSIDNEISLVNLALIHCKILTFKKAKVI